MSGKNQHLFMLEGAHSSTTSEEKEHSTELGEKEHSTAVGIEQSPTMSGVQEHPLQSELRANPTILEVKERSIRLDIGGNSVVSDLEHPSTMLREEETREDHLDNFEDFFKDLNQAADSTLPVIPRKYNSVHALLLRWQDDDLGVESEIIDLDEVLTNVYHYSTEKYLIPSEYSSAELELKLVEFRNAHDTGSALPSNLRRYGSIHALLIRWQDDDLGTEKEIDALDDVLKNVYRYKTEKYLIPSHDSSWQLQYRVSDFRNAHNKATSLLIVYYGGHGRLESRPNKASKSIRQANGKSGVHLIWSNIQCILEQAEGDVLFILDCCYAATAVQGRGAKEGLWACKSEATTTGMNDNSLTQNLIAELRSSSSEKFNVAMLHNRLMRRYLELGDHELLTEPMHSYLGGEIYPSVELVP